MARAIAIVMPGITTSELVGFCLPECQSGRQFVQQFTSMQGANLRGTGFAQLSIMNPIRILFVEDDAEMTGIYRENFPAPEFASG